MQCNAMQTLVIRHMHVYDWNCRWKIHVHNYSHCVKKANWMPEIGETLLLENQNFHEHLV